MAPQDDAADVTKKVHKGVTLRPRLVLLIVLLVTTALAMAFFVRRGYLRTVTHPMLGSYTQETFEVPYTDESGFQLEAIQSSLSINIDPDTEKLSVVQISTVKISYVPAQNKVITTYTVEWRYKEISRNGVASIEVEGTPRARFGLENFNLHGLIADEAIARKFDDFKKKISGSYQSGKATMRLDEVGHLEKKVTYNGGDAKISKYLRT